VGGGGRVLALTGVGVRGRREGEASRAARSHAPAGRPCRAGSKTNDQRARLSSAKRPVEVRAAAIGSMSGYGDEKFKEIRDNDSELGGWIMTGRNTTKVLGAAWWAGFLMAALIATAPLALADDPPSGATTVTDGEGNPIPREDAAGTQNPTHGATTVFVQRGQAWWPYAAPPPPYTAADRSVESLNVADIVVNGVVTLDIRDPQASLQQIPPALLLKAGDQLARDAGFYLVKIDGFTRNQQQVDALEAAGAVLGELININTYVAKIPAGAIDAVSALPFVSYVGDYHPAYKISPRIGLEDIPSDQVFDPETGAVLPWMFELTVHKGASLQEVLDGLGLLGISPAPEGIDVADELTTIYVRTAPELVPSIAQIPGVKWIAEKTYPQLWASSTSPVTIPMILQNNGVFTTNTLTGWKLWNAGLNGAKSGSPQVVTMMDSGLNTNMEHFAESTASVGTVGASHRKVVGYDNYGGDVCVLAYTTSDGGHGTWTSQQAVGSISNMSASPDTTHVPNVNWDTGIAPGAKVYFQDIGTSSGSLSVPSNLGPSITAAIGKGSWVQNHSWGTSTDSYDTQASNLDTAIYGNPGFVVTVSAGNRGAAGRSTIGSPCTSKNVICVGGNDAYRPDYLFADCNWDGTAACSASADLGSSRGPVTTSNRVKPDIMTYVYSSSLVGGENFASERPRAMCQTDGTKAVYWDYTNNPGHGGTSFAAPEVAGLAALVRDYFLSGFYPSGTAKVADAMTPSGTLVKALVLASGEDMATTAYPSTSIAITKRYSPDVGYGRANLPAVLHIGSGAPFLWVQNNDTLGDGSTKTFFYNINGNGTPLRVMMAWYDAAGNALQKDADLKVTIGSNVYWGNNLSSGWSTTATATRDHTNNTEGVFVDASHGLPATGTVRVDVVGYSNPGGLNYSLVVVGDVASQSVTQVSLDKAKYTCSDAIKVTVNDAAASSPVAVTLVSKDSGGTTIDIRTLSATGTGGVFTATALAGADITVADGGSVVATYDAVTPASAAVSCQLVLTDSGFAIAGGCDNAAAGTDIVTGPFYNGSSNEYYNKYMDGGEYSSYTVKFVNRTGVALSDVYVTLSFSGPGASYMSAFNNPVHVGSVPVDGLAGAVFQIYTDPSAPGLTAVNMEFDVTSPANGYTAPKRLIQVQVLQANDVIARQSQCSTFDTGLAPWYESSRTGAVANPWRWSGAAVAPSTVGSETRTDGACGSNVANAAAMVGNSGTTSANNFATNADSFLLLNFQPALRGTAPNGQPYHYVWKWHSFYHASETLNNQGGVWGAFYSDQWNSSTNPTGDQAASFPIAVAYYYHTILDYVGTWNWETANTGTPDDPRLGPSSGGAPNQMIVTFAPSVTGFASSGTYFSYGHEHADIYFFNGGTTHGTHRDAAIDNDRLVYDEYYTAAQDGPSCGGSGAQVGQVAFDRLIYDECPNGTAILSVLDADAVSPIQVVVTSPGTGDSEVVTLTGTAPYFSGSLALSTQTGRGNGNGVLFVLPSETIQASYADASPVGTTSATAGTACTGGNVSFVSNTQVSDSIDNDGIADNNETVTMDITIKNGTSADLSNVRVTIFSDTPNVDCISDYDASYGTVSAGATATNPSSDRFTFHVSPSVACTDWQAPPTARFTVVITGDGLDGAATLQTFTVNLDLDTTTTGGAYNYTQTFATDPGWTTGATADDSGSCAPGYVNNFHWCAACGNGGGGYGAWIGNGPWGTSGQNYSVYDSSTLYSPMFVAGGNVTLQFSVAYRTEATYDGAIVQSKVGSGDWTTLGFTTPSQASTTTSDYCSPLAAGVAAWTGTGVGWTATNSATVAAAAGQSVQFRWRLGADSVTGGTTYGGYGVDNVAIGNLRQMMVCEPSRNACAAACSGDVITCPASVTSECSGSLQATVSLPPATANDVCTAGGSITNNYNSGGGDASGDYPVGSTTVMFTAADGAGNSASCQTSVTVQDTLAPTLGASPVTAECQGNLEAAVSGPVATATDVCQPTGLTITNSYNGGGADASGTYPLGTTPVIFGTSDAAGNPASVTVDVTVQDTTPPSLTVPESVVTECQGSLQAEVALSDATATDVCQPTGLTIINSHTPNGASASGSYPLGATAVTFTAADGQGNHSSGQTFVTVLDTTPPAILCPAPILIECQVNGQAMVPVPAATATDVCQAFAIANSYTAGGADASGVYPLGTTLVTFTATDGSGNASSCQTSVTVVDTTPPVITAAAVPGYLWPPNHKMATVNTNLVVTDACDPNPGIVLVSATSSEPDDAQGGGDGNTVNDIQGAAAGTADFQVLLRAEREGKGPGRVYTLTYRTTDYSGNTSTTAALVNVPHDLADVVEPLDLHIDGAHSTSVAWGAVQGAVYYDVIRGDLENLRIEGSNVNLGMVSCIARRLTATTTAGHEDTAIPEPGKAFFYAVQFNDGIENSSYGSESVGRARVVESGNCP
jgi:hypothetical protein